MTKFTLLITALLTILLLSGCGSDDSLTLGGEADVNVNAQDNFTACEVRQNGNVLFVRQTGGFENYGMSFDPAVVYEDKWIELSDADALRVTPYTQIEADIINGDL